MKNKARLVVVLLFLPVCFLSCLKEDNVRNPTVSDVKMYMIDVKGKDSLISQVYKEKEVKIVVYTDADLVSIWPAGSRIIMKKVNSTVDSIDMFNHPVLVYSDHYTDYGLVSARGLATTLTDGGWYAFYKYPEAGDFDLTVVATNNGYDSPDLKRIIHQAGKVNVK